MDDADYIKQLEQRLASLRAACDSWEAESRAWQEKYEGVQGRIEALEMIVADTSVTASPPVGRTLRIAVTVDEQVFWNTKDSEGMAEMFINDTVKRLLHELNKGLISGQLQGDRVPMLRRAKWVRFSDH